MKTIDQVRKNDVCSFNIIDLNVTTSLLSSDGKCAIGVLPEIEPGHWSSQGGVFRSHCSGRFAWDL